MNKKLIIFIAVLFSTVAILKAQNPFEEYGYNPGVLTLSDGQYNEFFTNDTVVQIGSVLFNTITESVIGFVELDTVYDEATLEPDVISRWLAPDPLAEKYTEWSPYNYVLNNPIINIDPDGNEVWKTIQDNGNGTSTVTIHVDIRVTNSGGFASKDVARWSGSIALQIESSYSGKSADGKTTYIAKVNMDLSGKENSNFYTMDFTSKVEGTSESAIGRMDGEFGNTKVNNIQIEAPGSDNGPYQEQTEESVGRTGAHEVGHTGNLYHPSSEKNNIAGVDVQGNLMHQSSNDKAGTTMSGGQLDEFVKNVQVGRPQILYDLKPVEKEVKNQY